MTEYELLISDVAPAESVPAHRFGGRPLVAKDSKVAWPNCKSCKMPMQFLGQLLIPTHDQSSKNLILIFMCDRDPGACDTWMPDGGGNHVVVVPIDANLTLLEPPAVEGCLRNITYGVVVAEGEGEAFYKARQNYTKRTNIPFGNILGYLFGEPEWWQYDETPKCMQCKKQMRFVALLTEGPGDMESMNFGIAYAYLFDCECGVGKFLWQC